MNCELCAFDNPKGSVTAIVMREGKVLVLKRNEEPFKDAWDFPGGYMNRGETPEETLKREIKEELGVDSRLDFIGWFPGTGSWKGKEFAVLNHAYLTELQGEIKLNDENSTYKYRDLNEIKAGEIAFDSNGAIVKWLKEKFNFDLGRVKELGAQLDPKAEIKEQSLYRAILGGYVATKYDGSKLIGIGWIFPRQTLLRRQAVIEDMIVDDAYRGRGLGRKILRDLIRWAKENGVEVIELVTNPKRVAANELYKSEGFWLHPTNHYLLKL